MEETPIELINRLNQISERKDQIIKDLRIKSEQKSTEGNKLKSNLHASQKKVAEQADELAKLRQENEKLVMTIERMKQEHQLFQKQINKQITDYLKAEIKKQESKVTTDCEIEQDNNEMTTNESEMPGPSNLHIKYVKEEVYLK